MKTKTLLVAAAALAVGVISSQAQVYSQNIVGYVNAAVPAGQLTLLCNPLDNGTNTGNDVLATLPNKSTIQLWNGSGYSQYTKTSSGFTPSNPNLPLGTGFFVKSGTAYTNTFVGNVVPNSGGNTVTNPIPAGVLALVGSALPVGGTFNDVGTNTLNLAATLPNKSTVQTWNGSGFTQFTKTSSGFTPSNPGYAVSQGFFLKAGSAADWVQTLQ